MNIIQKQKLFSLDFVKEVFSAYPESIPELSDNYISNTRLLDDTYKELLQKYIFEKGYIII